ncbi:MAG: glutamine--fructose-6-phosphate aminotransferase, partial [Clostridia bacterium]|nr:glutamine--fructose-6-phosphate aminotransferase [Clostridia bacterium]
MCGIVGYSGRRTAAKIILKGLSGLEYRGYDSAGVAICEDGQVNIYKTKGRLSALADMLEKNGLPHGSVGIGHTRWATHGEPSDSNSHPHSQG